MNKFEIFFSSETDMSSSQAWIDVFPSYRLFLDRLQKRLGYFSQACGISYITTIYDDLDGVKERLYFSKRDNFIDYRPIILSSKFVNLTENEKIDLFNSLLPEVSKKTHLYDLSRSEKERINHALMTI